jgi:hypothetical protein
MVLHRDNDIQQADTLGFLNATPEHQTPVQDFLMVEKKDCLMEEIS